MNAWQFLRQLRYLLKDETWTTGSPAFADDSVIETVAPDESVYTSRRSPLCLIAPGSFTADPQEPTLLRHAFAVRVVVTNAYDLAGEASIIGSNRTSQTDSRGRGLLELEEKVFDAIAQMDRTDGVRIIGSVRGRSSIALSGEPPIVASDYDVDALVTADRTYPPVRKQTGSASGTTNTLSWTLPATRYDTLRVVVRRASGATAPATAADGTGVTLASDLATSVTDAPGAGTFSYSIFMAFDEYGSSTEERYSSAKTVTSLVTTAATFFDASYFAPSYFGPFFRAVA